MENAKQVAGSSSSFTLDLFGPKDSSSSSSSSSTGLFDSVFGPPSTGLGRDSSHSGLMGSMRKQDLGIQYATGKHGTSDNTTDRGKGESCGLTGKDKSSIHHQSEILEPCCFSSSIYYGGQEVYSPISQSAVSQHVFKKDGGDENSASRGNWWQESLYY